MQYRITEIKNVCHQATLNIFIRLVWQSRNNHKISPFLPMTLVHSATSFMQIIVKFLAESCLQTDRQTNKYRDDQMDRQQRSLNLHG